MLLPTVGQKLVDTSIDAVVMFTWSDWHTEPRSNRYHYATRFARRYPVYFVQPDSADGSISFEAVDGTAITLVHVPMAYDAHHAGALCAALWRRGVRAPLAWVYNPFFRIALNRLSPILTIFHATEDFLSPVETLSVVPSDVSASVRDCLDATDIVVAVSEDVADAYREHGPFTRQILVLPNGCDFQFWIDHQGSNFVPPANGTKVALFQGGINQRLDFDLLREVTSRLPDWQFWFCGRIAPEAGEWSDLASKDNVRYFGTLSPEQIAEYSRQATVGLIPFKQDGLMRRSLPLKAYEYIACGLPVVTTPITALAAREDLFTIAENPASFADAMNRVASTRVDTAALAARFQAARLMSYDLRFEELLQAVDVQLATRLQQRPRLNILVLYDDRSTHIGTVREHLQAFENYSRHKIHFLAATGQISEGPFSDLNAYDAICIHYSVRLSLSYHIAPQVATALEAYCGPKLMFIQDEYDTTSTTLDWIERLGIDTLFTNVPPEGRDKIYPRSRFPQLTLLPTLTGYVPEDPLIESFVTPLEERSVMIGYRGRRLPHHYGALGYEKYRIGVEMKRIAEERGLAADIEVDDSKRIYGRDWYRFMGSVRATLGTESGANVFDFDGSLAKLAAEHRDMHFQEFAEKYLVPHEGLVKMNQISPKIFEAIRLRTALILFEGNYSDAIKADRHFIPLKKDFSNIDDVLRKLSNLDYVRKLTQRAYDEIVGSGVYSYRAFIAGIDQYLDGRARGRRRATILSVPALAIFAHDDTQQLWHDSVSQALLSDIILAKDPPRELIIERFATQIAGRREAWVGAALAEIETQRLESERLVAIEAARLEAERLAEEAKRSPVRRSLKWHIARTAWRLMPAHVRHKIALRIKGVLS